MFARLRPIVLSALICTTLLARAAGAQSSIEVGPLISLYSPVGSYHHDATYFVVGTPDTPSDNGGRGWGGEARMLSLIHISEPTRRTPISYAVFCLKKK